MKFIIPKKVFYKGLSNFKSITRHSMNILLKIQDDMLEIKSGHTDISMICRYKPDETIAEGGAVTNALYFTKVIQQMPDKPVAVELKDNRLHISCGDSIYFKLPCITNNCYESESSETPSGSGNEFPDLSIDEGDSFSVSAGVLKDMISKVLFAISTDNTNAHICGAFLQKSDDGGSLVMAGTDGHRFAIAEDMPDIHDGNDTDKDKLLQKGILIPREGLQEILKLCTGKDQDDLISIKIDNTLMNIECNNTRLHLRLISGKFVDYKVICNTEMPNYFSANRESLLSTLKQASVIGDYNGVLFKSNGNGTIAVTAEDSEKSRWSGSIKAAYEGEAVNLRFNHNYLIDVLQAIDSKTVKISYNPKMLNVRTDDNSYSYIMGLQSL